jgi:hypothetical protein
MNTAAIGARSAPAPAPGWRQTDIEEFAPAPARMPRFPPEYTAPAASCYSANIVPGRRTIMRRPTQRLISDEEILRLYAEEEMDSDTISYRAGCSSTTVLDIVRKLGGVVRGRGGCSERKTLKLTDAEIIQRYKDGASGLTLAEQAGCEPPTIYRVLHSHGVRTRTPTESGAAARVRNPLDRTKN